MSTILNHSQRKFILTLLVFFASSIFLYAGKIDAGSWQVLMTTVLGGYFTANIVDKKVNNV